MKNIFKTAILLIGFSGFAQNEADLPDGVGLPTGTDITTYVATDKIAVFDIDNNSNRLILIDDLLPVETVTTLTQAGNLITYVNELGLSAVVDLAPYLDNTDDQQITTFSLDASNILTITLEDGGTQTVDLSALKDNTDAQTITIAGDVITLGNGTGADTTVDLSPYKDNTDAQTLSLSGSDLTISNGNTVTLPSSAVTNTITGNRIATIDGIDINETITGFGTPIIDNTTNITLTTVTLPYNQEQGTTQNVTFDVPNSSGSAWNNPDGTVASQTSNDIQFDNGYVGVAANPTEAFDVNGRVRVRDLPQGDNKSKMVVANSFGVLRKRDLPECFSPEPDYVEPITVNQSTNFNIILKGSYFTPTTIVYSTGGIVINSHTFLNDNEISVSGTSLNVDGSFQIIVENSCGAVGYSSVVNVETSVWLDLRAGGDTFTDGNGSGNDIRYRAGMTMIRDANGMFFMGSNPWATWVKFESESWTRGSSKTIEWILTAPTAAMMIGIGSDATSEMATDQYRQSEINAYFQNANTFWGLYGNNGTVGVAGNQALSTSIAGNTVFKVKFENDGGVGQTFTLYALPSANPSDWDDESTVLRTATIAGSLNPDETNLMPYIIPRTDTQRFIALKVN